VKRHCKTLSSTVRWMRTKVEVISLPLSVGVRHGSFALLGEILFATLILAQSFAVVDVRAWRVGADPIDVSRSPEPPRPGGTHRS
jgi:hypothetical protein